MPKLSSLLASGRLSPMSSFHGSHPYRRRNLADDDLLVSMYHDGNGFLFVPVSDLECRLRQWPGAANTLCIYLWLYIEYSKGPIRQVVASRAVDADQIEPSPDGCEAHPINVIDAVLTLTALLSSSRPHSQRFFIDLHVSCGVIESWGGRNALKSLLFYGVQVLAVIGKLHSSTETPTKLLDVLPRSTS